LPIKIMVGHFGCRQILDLKMMHFVWNTKLTIM